MINWGSRTKGHTYDNAVSTSNIIIKKRISTLACKSSGKLASGPLRPVETTFSLHGSSHRTQGFWITNSYSSFLLFLPCLSKTKNRKPQQPHPPAPSKVRIGAEAQAQWPCGRAFTWAPFQSNTEEGAGRTQQLGRRKFCSKDWKTLCCLPLSFLFEDVSEEMDLRAWPLCVLINFSCSLICLCKWFWMAIPRDSGSKEAPYTSQVMPCSSHMTSLTRLDCFRWGLASVPSCFFFSPGVNPTCAAAAVTFSFCSLRNSLTRLARRGLALTEREGVLLPEPGLESPRASDGRLRLVAVLVCLFSSKVLSWFFLTGEGVGLAGEPVPPPSWVLGLSSRVLASGVSVSCSLPIWGDAVFLSLAPPWSAGSKVLDWSALPAGTQDWESLQPESALWPSVLFTTPSDILLSEFPSAWRVSAWPPTRPEIWSMGPAFREPASWLQVGCSRLSGLLPAELPPSFHVSWAWLEATLTDEVLRTSVGRLAGLCVWMCTCGMMPGHCPDGWGANNGSESSNLGLPLPWPWQTTRSCSCCSKRSAAGISFRNAVRMLGLVDTDRLWTIATACTSASCRALLGTSLSSLSAWLVIVLASLNFEPWGCAGSCTGSGFAGRVDASLVRRDGGDAPEGMPCVSEAVTEGCLFWGHSSSLVGLSQDLVTESQAAWSLFPSGPPTRGDERLDALAAVSGVCTVAWIVSWEGKSQDTWSLLLPQVSPTAQLDVSGCSPSQGVCDFTRGCSGTDEGLVLGWSWRLAG